MNARANFLRRMRLIVIAVFLFSGVLVVRLYFIQVVHGEEFSLKADRQYTRPNQSLYDRGSIFFSDKDGHLVAAATLKSGYVLAVNPDHVLDPEAAYEALSSVLPLEKESFIMRASKEDDPYEEIENRVEEEKAQTIEALKISGVELFKERWRYYPGGMLGAHAIGFVAYKDDELAGRYGLERYYEDVLSRDGSSLYVNFFAEIFANVNRTLFERDEYATGDVITTIEPSVQLYLEKVLKETQDTYSSRETAGIIMNPKTGEIYALGVAPSFDLNRFNEEDDARIFSNPLVESVFEMGSIIKPLTLAAGLDLGVINPDTTYYDPGFLELDGYTIYNYDKQGRGTVSMQEVLKQSLNTGVAFVVNQMGTNRFRDYFYDFALGQETGIDLPNEAHGLVENLESPRQIEYATASYGQGIALTPIATVRALAVLANGGRLVTPHLAKEIRYASGLTKTVAYPDDEQVLKPETSEEISRMLTVVVDEALRGGAVKLPHYSVAAKTGTAQIANEAGGGYYEDRYLHSFFGYFPSFDPEFLVFLYTREPKGVQYSSETLTEPFMDITEFLINYYSIPPDR